MYQIIDNPKLMTKDEIDKTYDGKWVYIVKANVTREGTVIDGTPVIIADEPYEGVEDGIYEHFRNEENEERLSYDLLHHDPHFIPSVFSVEFV